MIRAEVKSGDLVLADTGQVLAITAVHDAAAMVLVCSGVAKGDTYAMDYGSMRHKVEIRRPTVQDLIKAAEKLPSVAEYTAAIFTAAWDGVLGSENLTDLEQACRLLSRLIDRNHHRLAVGTAMLMVPTDYETFRAIFPLPTEGS